MAQYIAEDQLRVVVSSEIPQIVDQKGRLVQPRTRRTFAQFERGTAPQFAREIAAEAFTFDRIPLQEMGGATLPIGQWLAFYDSYEDQARMGWSDEEREAIEARLDATHGVVRVERPKLQAPWPTYDKIQVHGRRKVEHVAEKIIELVRETGADPDHVYAYEQQNANREEVLAALVALNEEEPVEEEEVVAA